MPNDDIQVTTPALRTYLIPRRSDRVLARAKALGAISQIARAVHEHYTLDTAEDDAPATAVPIPAAALTESHSLLAPATAMALNQLHMVEGALMVRAMIEAAKADGEIDPEERRRILICLVDADAAGPDRRALIAALDQPPDVDGLVARVTSPELALEVYTASLLAIRDDKPSEQRYLAQLAMRLALSPATVADIHARFGDPPPLAADA